MKINEERAFANLSLAGLAGRQRLPGEVGQHVPVMALVVSYRAHMPGVRCFAQSVASECDGSLRVHRAA